jgi:transcriptional regulator with XRE-family HTH domain
MNIREIIQNMGFQMRKARQLKQDRQKDLAARMGVSRLTVMKMEKGGEDAGRIPLETWLKAADYLGQLDSWQKVMHVKADPFEEYDARIREAEQVMNARVKKAKGPNP